MILPFLNIALIDFLCVVFLSGFLIALAVSLEIFFLFLVGNFWGILMNHVRNDLARYFVVLCESSVICFKKGIITLIGQGSITDFGQITDFGL